MPISFPSSPQVNDTYTYSGVTWKWTGSSWNIEPMPITLTGDVTGSGYSSIATVIGTVPTTKGGTGLTTIGSAGQLLRVNSGGTGLEYYTPQSSGNLGGNGLSGQVAIFNGTSSLTGLNTFFWDFTNTRLGINTNLPAYTLDVNGTGRFSGSVTASGGLISNGGSIGYGGGELGFGVTTSGATSGIYTLAPDSPILYFDHRATGNTGFWVWRSGTGGGTTAMTLSNAGAATFSSSVTATSFISSVSSGANIVLQKPSGPSIEFQKTAATAQTWQLSGEGSAFKLLDITAGTTPFQISTTGAVTISGTLAWNNATPLLNVGGSGDARIQVRHIWGKAADSSSTDHLWLQYQNSTNAVQIGASGGTNPLYVAGDIYMGGYFGGNLVATRTWVQSQGYITGYTETDTLASVTGRGANTATALTLGSYIQLGNGYSSNGNYGVRLEGVDNGTNGHDLFIRTRATATGGFSNSAIFYNTGLVNISNNLQVGSAFTYDNPGGWGANVVAAGTNHARFRLRATSFNGSGDGETYLWLDNTVTPSTGIFSGNSIFIFNGSINTVRIAGSTVLHSSNYSSFALPLSGGTLTGDVIFTNLKSSLDNAYGFIGRNVYADTVNGIGSDPLELNYYDGGPVKIGSGANGSKSLYAVGIYDNGNQVWHAGNDGSGTGLDADTVDGYHATNAANGLAYYASNGYLYAPSWIRTNSGIYADGNAAHFYPNDGTYGAWRILGSRNGWGGIEFGNGSTGAVTLMTANNSNTTGFHNNSYGWQLYWENGTAYVGKSAYGGGTSATVLDSVNFNSYAPTLTGTGASGSWGISITGSSNTSSSLYGGAGAYIKSSATGTSYQYNYQVRENDGGNGNSNLIYAPQLAFHWANVVASSIMMEASGRISIRNNPGDAYENFIANNIFGYYFNSSAGNSENPTIGQIWTQNTTDDYLRKSTPAHFISQLSLLTTSNYSSYAAAAATTPIINTEYSATISSAAWYTIASYGSGRAVGTFHIYDQDSSRHNYVEAKINWSFGYGGITIVNNGRHSVSTIKHIRLLYNTTDQTYGGVKVQVYCENPTWVLRIRQEFPNNLNGWGIFTQVSPTPENAPSGWAEYTRAYNVNERGAISVSNSVGYLNSYRILHEGNIDQASLGFAPYHSGSDFASGTLVTTDIPASASEGASYIIEVTGKTYDSGQPPFRWIGQGYLYANTIINHTALSETGYAPTYMKVFNHSDNNLAFWWPRVSYWNSFAVHVRDAGGSIKNRVTGVNDSTEPASTKKVQTNIWRALTSVNFTTYAPSLTGSGASGTWGINITGNAATAAEAQNNYFYVRGTSPSVLLVDTDQGETRYVHHNGGSIGFLNTSGNWVLRCDNTTTYGTFNGSLTGNASTATTADSLTSQVYNISNEWLRDLGDNSQFKIYGNGRTIIYRTDGNTNEHGGGGYAHIFYYGGSADGNRVFIINTDGRLYSPYHGWLDTMSISGNAATATNVAASGITGQTGMWTSTARPGPYRLYRNDDNSAYNVQTTWSADRSGYWSLRGYLNDGYHAPCYVAYSGYADSAGSAGSVNAGSLTGTVPVGSGGTGVTSFTAGRVLIGNGGSPITTAALQFTDNKLGVARTDPSYTLDVAGVLRVDSTQFLMTPGTGDAALEIGISRTGNGFAYLDLIGDTSNTDYGLRVMRGNGGANTFSQIVHVGSGDFYIKNQDNANIIFQNVGVETMRINTSNRLLIGYFGTDNGGYLLQVNSSIYVNGTVYSSDARLKENIQDIGSTIDLVMNMLPRTYTFREDTGYKFSETGTSVGFIAQELDAILAGTPYRESIISKEGPYYGVSYHKIIPMLVRAIQELKTELDTIKNN